MATTPAITTTPITEVTGTATDAFKFYNTGLGFGYYLA